MASVILQNIVWIAALGVVLFWPAGTLAYPGGWAFVAIMLIGGIWISLWLLKHDPALLKKRLGSAAERSEAVGPRFPLHFHARLHRVARVHGVGRA